MRRILVGMVILSIVLVGCGQSSKSTETLGTGSGSTRATTITSTPAWAAEGNRLISDKAAAAQRGPYSEANAGSWAFLSSTVDVTGDGTYSVRFGPLPAGFDYPKSPAAVAWEFPGDAGFTVMPIEVKQLSSGSNQYLQLTFTASGVSLAYPGFSVWAY